MTHGGMKALGEGFAVDLDFIFKSTYLRALWELVGQLNIRICLRVVPRSIPGAYGGSGALYRAGI